MIWCSASVSPIAVMPRKRVFPARAQGFEGRNDFVADLRDAEGFAAAVQGDGVVQVEDVDVIHLQALQAAVHRVG